MKFFSRAEVPSGQSFYSFEKERPDHKFSYDFPHGEMKKVFDRGTVLERMEFAKGLVENVFAKFNIERVQDINASYLRRLGERHHDTPQVYWQQVGDTDEGVLVVRFNNNVKNPRDTMNQTVLIVLTKVTEGGKIDQKSPKVVDMMSEKDFLTQRMWSRFPIPHSARTDFLAAKLTVGQYEQGVIAEDFGGNRLAYIRSQEDVGGKTDEASLAWSAYRRSLIRTIEAETKAAWEELLVAAAAYSVSLGGGGKATETEWISAREYRRRKENGEDMSRINLFPRPVGMFMQ